jgi:hypothetical protein
VGSEGTDEDVGDREGAWMEGTNGAAAVPKKGIIYLIESISLPRLKRIQMNLPTGLAHV